MASLQAPDKVLAIDLHDYGSYHSGALTGCVVSIATGAAMA